MRVATIAVGALAGAVAGTAGAGTLYSQAALGNGGYVSHHTSSGTYGYSGSQEDQRIADNFSLAAASTITSMRWWGARGFDLEYEFYNGNPVIGLQIQILSVDAVTGKPDDVIHTYSAALNSFTATGVVWKQFDLDLGAGWALPAGDYFISVSAEVDYDGDFWIWRHGGPLGTLAADFNFSTAGWDHLGAGNEMAFELFGDEGGAVVPLPSAAGMGFLGLLVVGARRRRVGVALERGVRG